jgi:hypothetical protein
MNKQSVRQVATLPARTVISETQSEHNVEPSFLRTETDFVVCSMQCKNIDTTGVFFLIREFKVTPSFSNAKIGKNLILYLGKYGKYKTAPVVQ